MVLVIGKVVLVPLTDSGVHAEIALYCIDKGINVIIEKPIAMSLADADEIVRAFDTLIKAISTV